MEKILVALVILVLVAACGGGGENKADKPSNPYSAVDNKSEGNPDYDPNRGAGKWTAENIGITDALDVAKAESGAKISEVKCSSCHKLTEERLVGPGWKGVTKRRKAEWIMNFISNPDPMIEKDPVVQAQLELCLVRMPNQSLSDSEARDLFELMRKNDGVK
jgi:mono/diheme cytochrome c family protein